MPWARIKIVDHGANLICRRVNSRPLFPYGERFVQFALSFLDPPPLQCCQAGARPRIRRVRGRLRRPLRALHRCTVHGAAPIYPTAALSPSVSCPLLLRTVPPPLRDRWTPWAAHRIVTQATATPRPSGRPPHWSEVGFVNVLCSRVERRLTFEAKGSFIYRLTCSILM